MNKVVLAMILGGLMTGCAHKDLQSPCANVAMLSADATVPCEQREPINDQQHIPSTFAQR